MMFKTLVKITGVSLVYDKHNLGLFICLFLPVLVGSYFPDQESKLVLAVKVQHPTPGPLGNSPQVVLKISN